jgi:hypothetical protein
MLELYFLWDAWQHIPDEMQQQSEADSWRVSRHASHQNSIRYPEEVTVAAMHAHGAQAAAKVLPLGWYYASQAKLSN